MYIYNKFYIEDEFFTKELKSLQIQGWEIISFQHKSALKPVNDNQITQSYTVVFTRKKEEHE